MSAAARLGAFGLGNKPDITLYSSVPLRSFRDECEDGEHTPLNRNPSNPATPNVNNQRQTKGYGVQVVTEKTIHERYRLRRKMADRRVTICNWSVYVALSGLFLAILDIELLVAWGQVNEILVCSFVIRSVIVLLTVILDLLIISYHWTEILIISADTGQAAICMTKKRRLNICLELLICSCCPYPTTQITKVDWPILGEGVLQNLRAQIPLNVLCTIPMFCRLYLVCRFVVLRSALIQDPATRAIASFNQVSVDFPFVLKSLICDRPLTFVCVVSITFWSCASWILTQCERYGSREDPTMPTSYFLADYAWFEAVTFFAIGYGDLKVETYCGRVVAVCTGMVGCIFSSLITVLLSQRMLLSLAERRVNQLPEFCKALGELCDGKNDWKAPPSKAIMLHLRLAQRKLLRYILEFRQCRWKLRLKIEDEDNGVTVRRAFAETEDQLRMLRLRQQQLGCHLQTLASKTERLATIFLLSRFRQKLQQ
ncbi:CaMBD domain-containing protein [Aphelenchoides bicaudatus]|nr:CaMBD domain-containing protein [Aphelenchoides bicaudatus]